MSSKFLPNISQKEWDEAIAANNHFYIHDLITQPLHEELYRRNNFEFMDEISEGQQMMIAYDYIQSQVLQGGFIQLIQNHYISLLLPAIEGLKKLGNVDMVLLLDNVLKVYVLNQETLDKETTPAEFAALYQEFKEFEPLDEQFQKLDAATIEAMVQYAIAHPADFIALSA